MFHTDGRLFEDVFGTAEMRAIFDEEAFVNRFLEVEAALARAEARAGVIPEDAAEAITAKASVDHLDLDEVEANVAEMHLFSIALIDAWKAELGDVGEYVHWGATSQDISDTATLLQIREGLAVVERDLDGIIDALEHLVREHADTPMIGRTWHVHALPITFGLRAATWLDEVRRHRDRLDDLRERLLELQFFGAVGSLASLGEVGLDVQANLAEELDMSIPDTAWFAARDRFAELLATLAMIASTLGKIAKQVLHANRPEVGELQEPIPAGDIGSSTMPHKRNPFKSEEAVMLSRLVRSHAGTGFELMGGDDERDGSTWFADFAVLPEAFLYTSRILESVHEVLADLVVDPEAMRANLDIHGGLVTSEAVMMALAETVGRQTAHEIVHEAAGEAIDGQRSFAECLLGDERVVSALGAERIEQLTDPTTYTGLSERLARRTIE